jgi:hypothetical protein
MIFLDNAIRYTPKGGHVALNTWTSGNICGFTVSDNGIGIAFEDHQRIFERFFRVDTARTPRDGTGLGLAIAKSLIEAHRGTVSVESDLGQGARFIVRFPRANVLIGSLSQAQLPTRFTIDTSRPIKPDTQRFHPAMMGCNARRQARMRQPRRLWIVRKERLLTLEQPLQARNLFR